MRIPGSGCVSPLDLDLGWIELVSLCIHEMALLRGERVGGRGLLNHRKWQPVLSPLLSPHGSALCSLGATQILTAATISAPGKRDGDIIASSNLNVIQSSLNSANEQVRCLNPIGVFDVSLTEMWQCHLLSTLSSTACP